MICKYCGARYTGNKCPACGKVIPLVKRSTNLDALMSDASVTREKAPAARTFEQGLKEGYQKGLREGYANGFKEGQGKHQAPPAVPATAPEKPSVSVRPKQERPGLGKMAVLFALLLAVAAASGFIFSRIGYQNGERAGFTEGREKGASDTEKSYSRKIKELEERYQSAEQENGQKNKQAGWLEGYHSGRQAGEKAFRGYAATTPPAATTVPPPGPQEEYELKLPYKKTGKPKYDPVVEKIQKRLQGPVCGDIEADGKFGAATEKAVKTFQAKTGIAVTGIVDEETYYLMFPEERPEAEITPGPEQDDDNQQPSWIKHFIQHLRPDENILLPVSMPDETQTPTPEAEEATPEPPAETEENDDTQS